MTTKATPATLTDQRRAIRLKVADTLERSLALESRQTIYSRDLSHHGIDLADRAALHLVVTFGGRVVAAIRLIGPTPLPIEMASFVSLPQSNVRVLQVGGFWMDRSLRRVTRLSGSIFKGLRQEMVRIAERLSAAAIYLRTPTVTVRELYRLAGFEWLRTLDFWDPTWGPVYTMRLSVEMVQTLRT